MHLLELEISKLKLTRYQFFHDLAKITIFRKSCKIWWNIKIEKKISIYQAISTKSINRKILKNEIMILCPKNSQFRNRTFHLF